uniref:Thioredoxin domain-containing protein n=1 Tax=Panagrolaimus sp. JU765 TaxID=591449 RepID=A0AC34RE16_9BILA
MVLAANRFKNSAVQIVVVAFSLESAKPIIDEIQKRYIPDKTLIFLATDYTPDVSFLLSNNDSYLQDIVKSPLKNDQPTVYICENFSCSLPITDFDNLKSRLDHI